MAVALVPPTTFADPVVGVLGVAPAETPGRTGRRTEGTCVPCSLVSPRFACLEPPHLDNLPLENASECLTQH